MDPNTDLLGLLLGWFSLLDNEDDDDDYDDDVDEF